MQGAVRLPSQEASEIVFIHRNKDGNYYVGFYVDVKRGIHAVGNMITRELLIVGMNQQYFPYFCKIYGITIKEEKT